MKRRLFRLIKRLFVFLHVDNYLANKFHKSESKILGRLIPDPSYYPASHEVHVKRHGVFFRLFPADFSQWQIYSSDNFSHVKAALKILDSAEEAIILDIGGNCGHFSLVLAEEIRKKNQNYRIVTFEPNPRIFGYLQHNLRQNPQLSDKILLLNKAVGKEKGVLELQVPLRNSGAGSLVRNYEHEPHQKFSVDILSVDDYLLNNKLPVRFIKIDVENFELFVLQGAINTINYHKPAIYLEISGKDSDSRENIVQLLKNCGYNIYTEKDCKYIPYINNYTNQENLMDIFAVHQIKKQPV